MGRGDEVEGQAGYDPWGGDDLDSAVGQQFQRAVRDLAHVYGNDWPRLAAAIIVGTARDREMVGRVAKQLKEMMPYG